MKQSNSLTISKPPAIAFTWRSGDGKRWVPSKMRTTNLFYTLRMIWNHSMPEAARLQPYQRYSFSSAYTPEYMKKAVVHLFNELMTRDDLPGHLVMELHHMKRYLEKKRSRRIVKSK